MSERLAVLTGVWHKREYRAFLLIMVCLSLATSSTLPLITLYLVGSLHVALPLVGLFFIGEALLGLILGVVVGRRSDRWPSRVPAMRLAASSTLQGSGAPRSRLRVAPPASRSISARPQLPAHVRACC